jgi:hypothetical protein
LEVRLYDSAKRAIIKFLLLGIVLGGPGGIISGIKMAMATNQLKDFQTDAKNVPEMVPSSESSPAVIASTSNMPFDSAIILSVPTFLEFNSNAEIMVTLKNPSEDDIVDISVDFSDLSDFFNIEGQIDVHSLRPGMDLERRIKIKSKEEKGTFPVKIIIKGNGAMQVRHYTIKVGGTEIY